MQTSSVTSTLPEFGLPTVVRPDAVADFATRLGVSQGLSDLDLATRAIFAGPVSVEVDEDPEITDCSYFVFHVRDAGSPLENTRRRREWYKVSSDLLPSHEDKLRLTIDS